MKKMKRILSTLLAVTLLLGSFAGLVVFEVGAAPAATQTVPIEQYISKVYNTPEEKLASMSVMSKNDKYELYVDSQSGEIALREIASGNLLFSNPYDVASDKLSQKDTKYSLLSQILITYKDTTGATLILSSYKDAALNGQIQTMKIKNGVRVEYTIGREDTRKMVPKLILAESFDTYILDPLKELNAQKIIDDFDMERFEAKWNRIDVNSMRLMVRLAHIQRYPFLDTYKTPKLDENGEVVTDKRGDIEYVYPVFYEFYEDSASETDILTCEDMIKSNTEYTFEQMDADHEVTGYEAEDVRYPLFKLALEYYLGDDGVSVRLPCNGLRYDMENYTLEDISVLPYMGVGSDSNAGYVYKDGENTAKTDGYIFFPDGSGAIFDYETLIVNNGFKIPGKLYGEDYAYHALFGIQNQRAVRYPVYGSVSSEVIHEYTYITKNGVEETVRVSNTVKNTEQVKADIEALKADGANMLVENVGENAIVTQRGFVAMIESADSFAELELQPGGAKLGYNTVVNYFNPKPKDSYNLSDAISVAGNTVVTDVSDRKYTGSITLHYTMLCDEDVAKETKKDNSNYTYFETSWLGMAEAYRARLSSTGVLERLKDADVEKDIPLYIEVFGALETQQTIATIPVNMMTPLTSFEDIMTMYGELSGEGIKNINFKMTGFANGGMYYTVPSALDWEDAVGGKEGFKKLVAEANRINAEGESHLGLYPDFDFAYIYEDAFFDAVILQDDAVKTIDNRYSSYRQYSATQQTFVSFYQLAVSPSRYSKFYTELLKNYGEYGLKSLSIGSLGSTLNSDFDEEDPYNREDSKEHTMQAFADIKNEGYSLMTDGGNAYTWAYADHILNAELDSSRYLQAKASVPFIGVVLHGSLQFAGTPLNEEGDIRYAMLRAIENGAGMYFILSYQNTSELKKDSYLSQYYSIQYGIWKEDIAKYYNELNELLKDVQTDLIVDHKFLSGERVLDLDELHADIAQKLEEAERLEDIALKEQQTAELIAIAEAWTLAYNADARMQVLLDKINAVNESVKAYGDTASLFQLESETLAVLKAMKALADFEAANAEDTESDAYVEEQRTLAQALTKAQTALTDKIANLREYTETLVNLKAEVEALFADASSFTTDLEAAVELVTNTSLYDEDEASREDILDQIVAGRNTVTKYLPEINAALEADSKTAMETVGENAVKALADNFYGAFEEGGAFVAYADYYEALLEEYGAMIFDAEDVEDMIVDNGTEGDDVEETEDDDDSFFKVDNSKIVLVVYGETDGKGNDTPSKAFILNYNTFAVRVDYDGITYTIDSGDYVVIDGSKIN